ncbi:hypothetical protein ACFL1S_00025 [Pseudomonadota bacterium]
MQRPGLDEKTPLPWVVFCWLVAGTGSFVFAYHWLPGTDLDGEIVPLGIDAFYHARRILDTVHDPGAFFQFDDRMHVPEGSWIVWPWFFDWSIAHLVRTLISIFPALDPKLVMVLVPPFWTFINAALLLSIGIQVGLRRVYLFALSACYALSPLTLQLHGAGQIDHHFAEQTMMFACLSATLLWMRNTEDPYRAGLLGCILGAAHGIHNGLFLLQAPVLATIFWCWWRGAHIGLKATYSFSASMLLTTLAVLAGSEPFLQLMFRVELLSWFHLYVTFATALLAIFIVRSPRSTRGVAATAFIALFLAIPVLEHVTWGLTFIGSRLEHYETLTEARALVSIDPVQRIPFEEALQKYTGLVVFLPIVLITSILILFKAGKNSAYVTLAVFTLFGATMMIQQHRFHQFGSFTLYLPVLVAIQRYLYGFRGYRSWVSGLILLLVLGLAYLPSVKYLRSPISVGGSNDFRYIWPIIEHLRSICADAPGLVLIDRNLAHHVRYFSECSVLANNFVTTKQHFEKVAELDNVLQGSAERDLEFQPDARYLVVIDNPFYGPSMLELLHRESEDLPPAIKPIAVATVGKGKVAYGRIFQVTSKE